MPPTNTRELGTVDILALPTPARCVMTVSSPSDPPPDDKTRGQSQTADLTSLARALASSARTGVASGPARELLPPRTTDPLQRPTWRGRMPMSGQSRP